MSGKRTFVSFGFGPITSGLFLYEAAQSGSFDRLVVAEIMPELVNAIRSNGGSYALNVATANGIEVHTIDGVELLNPMDEADRPVLLEALAEAQEISTALPSVNFFDRGEHSVARLLAKAFEIKTKTNGPQAVIYTAENNNHAAEALEQAVSSHLPEELDISGHVQYLNTVIGKMSGVVQDPEQIQSDGLAPMVPNWTRAFLVEEFNRILISKITLDHFERGIQVFAEKPDLMPFEEAKLFGHNATHASLGYWAGKKNLRFMSDCTRFPALIKTATDAFVHESGGSLIDAYHGLDPLFTPEGYTAYVNDLMERMMNPWLRDQVARVTRDPARKLGWNDRLIGTMRLALRHDIAPARYAMGAAAAISDLDQELPEFAETWKSDSQYNQEEAEQILCAIREAKQPLEDLLKQ